MGCGSLLRETFGPIFRLRLGLDGISGIARQLLESSERVAIATSRKVNVITRSIIDSKFQVSWMRTLRVLYAIRIKVIVHSRVVSRVVISAYPSCRDTRIHYTTALWPK